MIIYNCIGLENMLFFIYYVEIENKFIQIIDIIRFF